MEVGTRKYNTGTAAAADLGGFGHVFGGVTTHNPWSQRPGGRATEAAVHVFLRFAGTVELGEFPATPPPPASFQIEKSTPL